MREKLIATLANEDPALFAEFEAAKRRADGWSHLLRHSGRYPLCGRGRTNTYAVFAELMRDLAGVHGRAGVVVPTGIATDDTTKHFFRDLIERRSLVSLLSFAEIRRVFVATDDRSSFCLLTMSGMPGPHDPEFVFFARDADDLADEWRRFTLSPQDISRLNPNTGTCPTFRSRRDADVTRAIYARIPAFVHEHATDGNPWGAQFAQGLFNMSGDSNSFRDEPSNDRLPLFEGKMLGQFDHRYGTYAGQTQAQANRGTLPAVTEDEHADPGFRVMPRYWIDTKLVQTEIRRRELGRWFIAYRRVVRSVDFRTMIFTALPAYATGDKAALVALLGANVSERLAFLALANAFVADYVSRQKIGGISLDFFALKQIAIPTLASCASRVLGRLRPATSASLHPAHWSLSTPRVTSTRSAKRIHRCPVRSSGTRDVDRSSAPN